LDKSNLPVVIVGNAVECIENKLLQVIDVTLSSVPNAFALLFGMRLWPSEVKDQIAPNRPLELLTRERFANRLLESVRRMLRIDVSPSESAPR
jgi:hypothetical protein